MRYIVKKAISIAEAGQIQDTENVEDKHNNTYSCNIIDKKVGNNIFYATYGVTTWEEVRDAIANNKEVICIYTAEGDEYTYRARYVRNRSTEYYFICNFATKAIYFRVASLSGWSMQADVPIAFQQKLTAGNNITISDNTISASYNNATTSTAGLMSAADKIKLDNMYPIGSIYISITSTNPTNYFGGTWERFGKGKTLIGVDESDTDFSSSQTTGGEKTHTLTKAELPNYTLYSASHGHTASDSGHTHTVSYVNGYGTGSTYGVGYSGIATVQSSGTFNTGSGKANITVNGSTITVTSGGSGTAMNNLSPYITTYMWVRTA